MAGIDKIYITEKQLKPFMDWVERAEPKCLKETQMSIKDYLTDPGWHRLGKDQLPAEFSVSHFPKTIDMWILKPGNCDLDFVINRIKFQYNIK